MRPCPTKVLRKEVIIWASLLSYTMHHVKAELMQIVKTRHRAICISRHMVYFLRIGEGRVFPIVILFAHVAMHMFKESIPFQIGVYMSQEGWKYFISICF